MTTLKEDCSPHTQSTWKNPTSSSTYATDELLFNQLFYTTTFNILSVDAPVKPERYSSLINLKILSWIKWQCCPFVGWNCRNWTIMHRMDNLRCVTLYWYCFSVVCWIYCKKFVLISEPHDQTLFFWPPIEARCGRCFFCGMRAWWMCFFPRWQLYWFSFSQSISSST